MKGNGKENDRSNAHSLAGGFLQYRGDSLLFPFRFHRFCYRSKIVFKIFHTVFSFLRFFLSRIFNMAYREVIFSGLALD